MIARPPTISSSYGQEEQNKRHSLPYGFANESHVRAPGLPAGSYDTNLDLDFERDESTASYSARTLNDDQNSAPKTSIPKLDFVSHFESITQLNLKLESGDELTAEELGRGLKYLFSRYHGVLDSVGVFKARLDEENSDLRAQITELKGQLRDNDAEVGRLRCTSDQL